MNGVRLSVPGDTESEMDWTFHVPNVRNYIVLYGDAYAEDDVLPVERPARNPWHPGIYITRIPGIPKLDFHMEGVSTEQDGAVGDNNFGIFNYYNTHYPDGNTNGGSLIGNTVGRDGRVIQGWFTYWFSAQDTLQFKYQHSTVSADFIPGGGAWQDYSLRNEYAPAERLLLLEEANCKSSTFRAIRFCSMAHKTILQPFWKWAFLRRGESEPGKNQFWPPRAWTWSCDRMKELLTSPEPLFDDALQSEQAEPDLNGKTTGGETAAAKLRLVWIRRRLLLRFAGAGLILSALIAFLIPKQYESSTRLMPPDQANSNMAMLAAAASVQGGSEISSMASDLLGLKSSGALFIGILQSRTVQDDVINKFNLLRVYGVREFVTARKKLNQNTDIGEDRKSGIITIQVTDKVPEQAAAMAGEYVEELNRVVTDLNTSSAHRERMFLEGRLEQVKQDLEIAEKNFSQFASANTAIDIQAQGKAMIEAAGALEGQMIAAETERQGLKQIYSDDNVRVRAAQARVEELNRQLQRIGGKFDGSTGPSAPGDNSDTASMYPSIKQLPLLGVSYADYYRATKVQETIFETLTREYELAKVQEAKEIPSVKMIDPPDVPERKSYPPRLEFMLVGTVLAIFAGLIWIFADDIWKNTDPQDPQKALAVEIYQAARTRVPWGSRNGLGASAASHALGERLDEGQLDK